MSSSIKKNTIRKLSAISLLALSIAFVFVAPQYFAGRIGTDHFRSFFTHRVEPSVGIIKVWHIVSFKPYIGSLGSWLNERAKEYSSGYINVYFSVRSISKEEAEEELKRGELPDVISFSDASGFERFVMDGAVPFCRTGYFVVTEPNSTIGMSPEELIENAGSVSDFKKGKVGSCISDIRETGDLFRAQLIGECPYFEAIPYAKKEGAIQYLGLYKDISGEKVNYANGLIGYITGDKAQSKLSSIGLIPMSRTAKAEYEADWLNELYRVYYPAKDDRTVLLEKYESIC